MHRNQTWKLVPLPPGRRAIGNKWVYKIKRDNNDQVKWYQTRLMVKGYAQKESIDFNWIFSSIVPLTSIWVFLAICARFDLHLKQLDVETQFLHEEVNEEIYMVQLGGFEENGKENLVCKLIKSLQNLPIEP